ncbi:MAG TPA: hypothetical protein VFD35_07185 [Pricia sp.]|nr:hypothetical protein [Pricia sp.]
MKITSLTSPKWQGVLLCFVLSLTGTYAHSQSTTSTGIDSNVLYILGGAILVVFITTIFVIQKMANILGEYGLPLFDFDFHIFKRMTESRRMVAIIMILLVLWGIYLVVTYKVP